MEESLLQLRIIKKKKNEKKKIFLKILFFIINFLSFTLLLSIFN